MLKGLQSYGNNIHDDSSKYAGATIIDIISNTNICALTSYSMSMPKEESSPPIS